MLTLKTALIKIKYKRSIFHILDTFRSPDSDINTALDILSDMITSTRTKNYPLVIKGDINVNIKILTERVFW